MHALLLKERRLLGAERERWQVERAVRRQRAFDLQQLLHDFADILAIERHVDRERQRRHRRRTLRRVGDRRMTGNGERERIEAIERTLHAWIDAKRVRLLTARIERVAAERIVHAARLLDRDAVWRRHRLQRHGAQRRRQRQHERQRRVVRLIVVLLTRDRAQESRLVERRHRRRDVADDLWLHERELHDAAHLSRRQLLAVELGQNVFVVHDADAAKRHMRRILASRHAALRRCDRPRNRRRIDVATLGLRRRIETVKPVCAWIVAVGIRRIQHDRLHNTSLHRRMLHNDLERIRSSNSTWHQRCRHLGLERINDRQSIVASTTRQL